MNEIELSLGRRETKLISPTRLVQKHHFPSLLSFPRTDAFLLFGFLDLNLAARALSVHDVASERKAGMEGERLWLMHP